jgi:hypothetical protein
MKLTRSRIFNKMSSAEVARPAWTHYFVVRPDGRFVPMIAVDELPPIIKLPDLPATFDPLNLEGRHNCGNRPQAAQPYRVEIVGIPTGTRMAHTSPVANPPPIPPRPTSNQARQIASQYTGPSDEELRVCRGIIARVKFVCLTMYRS